MLIEDAVFAIVFTAVALAISAIVMWVQSGDEDDF